MKNTKHYDDRFDRGEDFTPVTDFPDELRICLNCTSFDRNMEPISVHTSYGDVLETRACTCFNLRTHDQAPLVEAETDACPCTWFNPTQEALNAAEDMQSYEADSYGYNGVSPKDFC